MRLESGISLQQSVGWDRATLRAARYLAECQSLSFLVTAPSLLEEQLQVWEEAFPLIVPTVTPNCDQEVISLLQQLGISFTITGKSELLALANSGAHLETTTLANSTPLGSLLRAARDQGVTTLWADSVEQLCKIKKFHPQARIILELGSGCPSSLSSEPGAPPSCVLSLLSEATRLGLWIEGVSLALPNTQEEVQELITRIKDLVTLAKAQGQALTRLHLTGICQAGEPLHPSFTEALTAALLAQVPTLSVTGDATHWLLAPTVTLAARIVAVRDARGDSSLPVQYYISEGVHGAFSNLLAGDTAPAPLPLGGRGARRGGQGKGSSYRLTEILGPSGDELDRIADEVVLPSMEEGDWLLFPYLGATHIQGFGPVRAVEGSRQGAGVRLKEIKESGGGGILPLEMAWAHGTANIRNISVTLDEGDGGAIKEGGGAEPSLGDLELGKTFIWEDCYQL